MLERFTMWAEGLDHPEGVAVSVRGEVFAGGEAGQIYAISDQGVVTERANTGGFLLGIALDADDRVYACDPGNAALVRWDPRDDKVETICSEVDGRFLVNPNYPAFGPDGTLYFTDSGEWKANEGITYMRTPDGEVRVFTRESTQFPNGCALSPDGGHLYVAESTFPAIVRYEIRDDGSAGPREIVAHLPGSIPDGLCFGEGGNLYVACYRPDRIYRITPERQVSVFAEDPEGVVLSAPTNLAFAGPQRDQLVAGSLGRWHLARADVGDRGAPLFYPSISY
jgi:gluconolactonase